MLISICTDVFSSSGHVTLTSTVSPTDFERTFKNRYSISKVASLVTLIPFVRIHSSRISITAFVI